MNLPLLFILLEGADDRRFVERVLSPRCHGWFAKIVPWEYAQEPNQRVRNLLKAVRSMGAEYFYLADLNKAPCVSLRAAKVRERHEFVERGRIIVVGRAIEAWYLAGLADEDARNLGIAWQGPTDDIDKQHFEHLMTAAGFDSRADCLMEILKVFRWELALERNRSLRYLYRRLETLAQGGGAQPCCPGS